MPEREWVSVRDPDDDHLRYTFDVSFLLSGYHCVYGAGCQGVREDGPDEVVGCCAHGAYMVDEDEAAWVAELPDILTPELMQFHAEGVAGGVLEVDDEGETRTRTLDDGCIFLNRADHPGGAGCALHHLAVERDEHHMTHKPTVCWQLPLHRTIDEEVANDGEELQVHRIGAYERGQWGAGGADFAWWCTEDANAFDSRTPVFRSMEHELREMVGNPVYEELATYLDSRRAQGTTVRFLPILT